MTTTVNRQTTTVNAKNRVTSVYVPQHKREVWDKAKRVAANMGMSRSDLILQLLSGVVACTKDTETPAFKLVTLTSGDSNARQEVPFDQEAESL
jgi:hypothetical protein